MFQKNCDPTLKPWLYLNTYPPYTLTTPQLHPTQVPPLTHTHTHTHTLSHITLWGKRLLNEMAPAVWIVPPLYFSPFSSSPLWTTCSQLQVKSFLIRLCNLGGQSKHCIWSLAESRKDLRDQDLNMEDSEKMKDMLNVLQVFERKKQACPVWPQKLEVTVIRLGSTYGRTLNRQCCLLVAWATTSIQEVVSSLSPAEVKLKRDKCTRKI